ncbi:MAG: glycosyltransferase family 4 protein [Janthinobacterium lividum]
MSAEPARHAVSVLYVSAVAEMKGGAETVLAEMLSSPLIRPSLAVPGPGALAEFAMARDIPFHLFELGSVAMVRRPLRLTTAVQAARDAVSVSNQLAVLARTTGADIVHTNGMKVHVTGVLARRLHGTPTVVHMHDVPYSRAERLIWRGLAAGALHTIAGSPICYDGMRRPNRVSVVMQGVDTAPARAARQLSGRPVLGFVGRFHPFKGVHLLLDWFEAVAAEYPALTLLLRGRADAEGERYWEALRPRAERLAAAGRCRIEEWRGSGLDPFDGIDILAAPSAVLEVGPRVVMEAMLRAIPVIGYPRGGGSVMIPRPEMGALADNASAFRRAVQRLLNPEEYAMVSAAALAHAAAKFGIERFWRDLHATYATALHLGGHGRA